MGLANEGGGGRGGVFFGVVIVVVVIGVVVLVVDGTIEGRRSGRGRISDPAHLPVKAVQVGGGTHHPIATLPVRTIGTTKKKENKVH